jgi:4-amino-4-deoxy-L-arabinose transferase-like glycosyltransferase
MIDTEAQDSPANRKGRSQTLRSRLLSAVALVVVLIAAAYLRLWGLEYSPTGGDQAVLLNIALRWVTQGKFPLAANKSSVGLMNPPLLEYLLAIPLFIRRDMVWVTRFVAALNLASVALTYGVVRPVFGRRTALLATLLYAVNPWAVYYSRLIWNPTMIPFFSTLLLGSLLAAFITPRRRLPIVLSFLWIAAAVQLHLASVALVPAVALLFWIFCHRLSLKTLLIGAALFALTFLPFVIYEIQTGFMDLTDFRQTTGGPAQTNFSSVAIAVELARGRGIWQTVGAAWMNWRAAAGWGEGLGAFVPWLLLAGIAIVGWRLAHRRDQFRTRRFAPETAGLITVAVLLAVPLLFYVRHSAYLQTYYFLYLYPLPFIVMALPADAALSWVDALPQNRRRLLRPLAWLPAILIVALAGWQFAVNQTGLQLLAQGAPGWRQIRHVQQAIDTLDAWGQSHPHCDLIVASNGYHAESSTLGQVGEFLSPRPVRYVQLDGGTIVPQRCALYLIASDGVDARAWYEAHTAHLPAETVRLSGDAWHFYELTPSARETLVEILNRPPVLGRWDNGVQLRRHQTPERTQPGDALKLSLVWEVYETPPKKRYHFFNHLVDHTGAPIAQTDGPGVYSRYWQRGEFFITWFQMTVPSEASPGAYQLLVGLYEWPSLARPHLTDGRDSLPLTTVEISAE